MEWVREMFDGLLFLRTYELVHSQNCLVPFINFWGKRKLSRWKKEPHRLLGKETWLPITQPPGAIDHGGILQFKHGSINNGIPYAWLLNPSKSNLNLNPNWKKP